MEVVIVTELKSLKTTCEGCKRDTVHILTGAFFKCSICNRVKKIVETDVREFLEREMAFTVTRILEIIKNSYETDPLKDLEKYILSHPELSKGVYGN